MRSRSRLARYNESMRHSYVKLVVPVVGLVVVLFAGAIIALERFNRATHGYGILALWGLGALLAVWRIVVAVNKARAFRKAMNEAATETDGSGV